MRANNEIKYLESSDSYIIETIDGLNSFSNEKYLNKNRDIILGYLKNFAEIFIPIVSLIVTVIALLFRNAAQDATPKKQIQEIESRLEVIEKAGQRDRAIPENQELDTTSTK